MPASASPRRRPHPHLRLPPEQRLKVNEIFYSIQGESTFAGHPCVLVRLTGCQMRCRWCDTAYSFYEGRWMSRAEVLGEVAAYACRLVEITGGEPLLQPGARPLMAALCDEGYEVLLETGGGLDISGVDPRVRRVLDVKCPASGESENYRWENLELITPRDELKFVVADRDDYLWARQVVLERRLPETCAIHFAAAYGLLEPRELAAWVLEDRLEVRLQVQLHKILWGTEQRGV